MVGRNRWNRSDRSDRGLSHVVGGSKVGCTERFDQSGRSEHIEIAYIRLFRGWMYNTVIVVHGISDILAVDDVYEDFRTLSTYPPDQMH